MGRSHLIIEELSHLLEQKEFAYHQNMVLTGSIANQLKTITRIGRSYGVFLQVVSTRATSVEVPSSLKVGLNNVFCFRTSNPSDAIAINLPQANQLSHNEQGKAAYQDGFVYFPMFTPYEITSLIKEFDKPFKANFLTDFMQKIK